ncbi:hypothetical protein RchiOBHm_Chr1g0378921 [Rosa chinensis]|uniref:Uncharacterized protein n=1 Tax=Rosa chinensis TaxID=74649 RepID=A0A2P6SNI4_ROSCH|nr:hypothetical protein RchiOBHm_Chr1g0378921 [Rosa chinensis]
MVGRGSGGGRETDSWEMVEDDGGSSGRDRGNIWGGVIGSVRWGGDKYVDTTLRMASKYEFAQLYHGNQVANRW